MTNLVEILKNTGCIMDIHNAAIRNTRKAYVDIWDSEKNGDPGHIGSFVAGIFATLVCDIAIATRYYPNPAEQIDILLTKFVKG